MLCLLLSNLQGSTDNTVHFRNRTRGHVAYGKVSRRVILDPPLQESESGTQGFQSHLAAAHGAVVLGREAEAGDLLRAFLTESAVRLPEVDPLVLDTYFVSRLHRINKTPRRIRCYKALNWQNALLAAWLPRGDNSFVTVFMVHRCIRVCKKVLNCSLFPEKMI